MPGPAGRCKEVSLFSEIVPQIITFFFLHITFAYFCCILAAGTCTYREERDGIAYCVVYTFSALTPPTFVFLVFVLIVCSRVKTETFH